MKKILLLLLASAGVCFAANDYNAHNPGTIGDSDVILFETTGGTIYKTSASAIRTYTAYTLPVATASVLGGVKQGSGVSIAGDGTLSVTPYTLPTATSSILGGVKVDGTSITISGGVISAGVYTLPVATGSVLGGVKAGSGVTIGGDGTLSVTTYALPAATSFSLGGVIPDGTSITVDGSGDIAVGTVPWGNLSGVPSFATVATSGSYTDLSGRPTLPSGSIVGTTDSQTLTNKSIAASEINSGTLTVGQGGTGAASLTAYAPLFGGTGSTSAVQSGTVGTAGQVLTSNGTGALPTFQNTGPIWKWVFSNTTLVPGEYVWPDTHSSSFTLTLPSSPPDGTQCVVADWGGTAVGLAGGAGGFGTNPVTVSSPSPNIWSAGGTVTSVVLNQNYQVATFFYSAHYGVWLEFDRVMTSPHTPGTPTIAGGTGAGTSPTVSVSGSDVSGLVTITPGSSPSTSATVATITYHTAYGTAPNAIILTPANAATAALSGTTQVSVSASNTGTFLITSGTAALTASTQYKWWYSVPQH